MRVAMDTVVVDDEFRRRLRIYTGERGLATRAEVKSWFEDRGASCNDDLSWETDDIWEAERAAAQ